MCLSVKSYNPSESVIQTYKARTMLAMYMPVLVFDDIKLCNQVGVYKNSNGNNEGLFDSESGYLQSLQPKNNLPQQMNTNQFAIYPNPANGSITIAYSLEKSEMGNVVIYDILGRERMNINLSDEVNKVMANLETFELGIFSYQFFINGIPTLSGKILKD
jgi:hypothetical protein